jgi:hypothetical protein
MTDPVIPETKRVDLFDGIQVELPKADADKLIAARDKRAADYKALAERVGAEEAAKRAESDKAAAAERRAAEMELAKKGEIDKLREIHTADLSKAVGDLSTKLVRLHVGQIVATNPRLVQEARDDAISLLLASTGFKLEGDKLQVAGADGRPISDSTGQAIGADAFIASWLEKRPHLLRDVTPTGTGAAGTPPSKAGAGEITRKAYAAAVESRDDAILTAVSAGKTRVVDG